MEWKLNPCFDIELSALTDIRRNSFVGRKRFKCRYKCEILRKTWKDIAIFFSRSADRSLNIKDPLVPGNR